MFLLKLEGKTEMTNLSILIKMLKYVNSDTFLYMLNVSIQPIWGIFTYMYIYGLCWVGKLIGRPGAYLRIFGLRAEECDLAGCFLEFSIMCITVMVGKMIFALFYGKLQSFPL